MNGMVEHMSGSDDLLKQNFPIHARIRMAHRSRSASIADGIETRVSFSFLLVFICGHFLRADNDHIRNILDAVR